MTWVKLCGIRDVAAAEAAVRAGADAIGVNFHPDSPRCATPDAARDVVTAVGDRVEVVGVFVNHPLDVLVRTVDALGLRAVQLHGDESPDYVVAVKRERPALRVVRAHRCDGGDLTALDAELRSLSEAEAVPQAVLVDARVPGAYGGTGTTVDWPALAGSYGDRPRPPLILAGGLRPDNVADAVRLVRPWGVDTASGVESAPGVKDESLMRSFVEAARAAAEDDDR